MPAPKIRFGTTEGDAETEFFKRSTHEQRLKRSQELGYATVNSYNAIFYRRGIHPDLSPIPPASPLVASDSGELTPEEERIRSIVKNSRVPVSVSELSRQLDRSSETIIKFIDSLRDKHYEIRLDEDSHSVVIPDSYTSEFLPTEFKYYRNYIKVGVVADTHMCSRYQQLTLLHDAYGIFDREKTDFNVHAGDLSDGQNMYAGHKNELFRHGCDAQADYIIRHYPKSARSTKTYVIGGNHDFCYWKRDGHNIVKQICKERKDLVYRGFFSAEFKVKNIYMALLHPTGGVAYARSYKIQKILEGMADEMIAAARSYPEKLKTMPHILVSGHWHVDAMLPFYMGITGLSAPCFQAQTPTYMKPKGLSPTIGCLILEVGLNELGDLGSLKVNFINMTGQKKDKDY